MNSFFLFLFSFKLLTLTARAVDNGKSIQITTTGGSERTVKTIISWEDKTNRLKVEKTMANKSISAVRYCEPKKDE